MLIPWQDLSPETLENLIESFVLREGTDYGEHERTLEQKTADVKRQLQCGEAVLVWSELHETVNIMPRSQFREQPATVGGQDNNDSQVMELLCLPNIRSLQ